MKYNDKAWHMAVVFAVILNHLKLIPNVDIEHVSKSKAYG